MRIEEFTIGGIPEGYRVLDVDLTPSGSPIATVGHTTDTRAPALVLIDGHDIELSPWCISLPTGNRPQQLNTIVRCVGEDQVLVVVPRGGPELNAWLFNFDAGVAAEFHVGWDVEEILTSPAVVFAFYGDEDHWEPADLESQWMSAFDLNGTLIWRYSDRFLDEPPITYFYAATWINEREIGVFADLAGEAALLRLNVRSSQPKVTFAPDTVNWASAVTVTDRWAVVDGWPEGGIRRWDLEFGAVTSEGEYSMSQRTVIPPRRGLFGGRFIEPTADGYRILSFD